MRFIFIVFLISFLCIATAKTTYYLPGVISHKYEKEEPVKLFVSQISSVKTQIPFDYYELPFCKPKQTTLENENLGEIISGDRIENSVYKIEMKIPKVCEIACIQKIGYSQKRDFIKAIHEDYKVHWLLDNLPVGMYDSLQAFVRGFPVGFQTSENIRESKHYLNNHIRIIIQYNDYIKDELRNDDSNAYIVGFRVEPMSIKHTYEGKYIEGITQLNTCNHQITPMANDANNYLSLDSRSLNEIIFTYDVIWEKSSVEWSNRWDLYLTANNLNDKVK
jgi:transmembrane 9 superfamily protein 2/4